MKSLSIALFTFSTTSMAINLLFESATACSIFEKYCSCLNTHELEWVELFFYNVYHLMNQCSLITDKVHNIHLLHKQISAIVLNKLHTLSLLPLVSPTITIFVLEKMFQLWCVRNEINIAENALFWKIIRVIFLLHINAERIYTILCITISMPVEV